MSNSVLIAAGAVEVIRTTPIIDVNATPLTGLTNIKISVVRDSDGKFLDFSNNTFTATPSQQFATMTELDAARLPGVYSYSLNTGAFQSPSANDKYKVYISQQGGGSAANASQSGELRVAVLDAISAAQGDITAIKGAGFTAGQDDLHSLRGQVVSIPAGVWATAEGGAAGTALYDLTLVRKFITNKMAENTQGQLVLYDDNTTTALKTWQLYDSTGGTVTSPTGEAARREAAT